MKSEIHGPIQGITGLIYWLAHFIIKVLHADVGLAELVINLLANKCFADNQTRKSTRKAYWWECSSHGRAINF